MNKDPRFRRVELIEELDIPCDKLHIFHELLQITREEGRNSMLKDLIKAKENIPDNG